MAQHCKKCGRELHIWDAKFTGDLCSDCYKEPLNQPGQIDVVHLSPKEYESWVRAHGPEVEIINVEREGGGLYSGGRLFPIRYRRICGYLVTYRKKGL